MSDQLITRTYYGATVHYRQARTRHLPKLGAAGLSRIISSYENTLDDIPELEGGAFVMNGVTSTKLTHLDLADMRLLLEAICRLNRCFPNLQRPAVGGWK